MSLFSFRGYTGRQWLAIIGLVIVLLWLVFGGGAPDIGHSLERVRSLLAGC